MSFHSEIDQTLRQLGTVVPPSGLEQRIQRGLQQTPRRFSLSVIYAISGGALAAGVALSAVALNPALRHLVLPQHAVTQNPQNFGSAGTPRLVPQSGGFRPAGIVHVPVEPVPVQPTPINQGRGRSRSGRATLPTGSLAPLPRGVAPSQPAARTGTADR